MSAARAQPAEQIGRMQKVLDAWQAQVRTYNRTYNRTLFYFIKIFKVIEYHSI